MLPGVAPGRGPPPVRPVGVPAAAESPARPAAPRRTGCYRRAVCAAPAWGPALRAGGLASGRDVRVRERPPPRVPQPRRVPRALRVRVPVQPGQPAWEPAPSPVRVPLRPPVRGGLCSAERFSQPACDGGLHRGGCGFNEFALFAQSGEHFFAGYTEFFSQLVYAGLTCHFSPVLEATAVVGRASGLAMTHGHRRDFTVCSCSSLPVLLPGAGALRLTRSTPAPRMDPVNR